MANVSSSRPPRAPSPGETTILVVDDEVLMLRLVEQTLRAEGYNVWTATRADEARRVLDELAGSIDVVLTDIAMPGRLGSQLAAEIRGSRRWVRVLYMSSYARDDLLNLGSISETLSCS